jgi:hypothetical protein
MAAKKAGLPALFFEVSQEHCHVFPVNIREWQNQLVNPVGRVFTLIGEGIDRRVFDAPGKPRWAVPSGVLFWRRFKRFYDPTIRLNAS